MAKETFYFPHDYNSRSDPKLVKLCMKHDMYGLGIYWCIIEMLYEQGGYISLSDIETIAFELRTQCERIKSVLQDFSLFKFEGEKFYSESVLRRLEARSARSEGARTSALKRWQSAKLKTADANAMRTQCEGNAIKEKKEKEIKEEGGFLAELFTKFWESYHSITSLPKSDKEAAEKHWRKLTVAERVKALKNIQPYYDSLKDKKYCKKARTYLADKNFNDEFETVKIHHYHSMKDVI